MYCLHHDEEALLGSDPVPCPFCGFGAEEDAPGVNDPIKAFGTEDSSDALRHALTNDEDASRSRDRATGGSLHGYW